MKNKKQKIGIILTNLGTPDTATTKAVSRYLWQFLTDPRIVDLPRWKWFPLLKGIILPRRSKRVARKYASIWTEQGSPLLSISKQQQKKLQIYLTQLGIDAVVELAMTYGNPSMDNAVKNLLNQGVDKLMVLPLFPQYSSTTTGAIFDAFARALKQQRNIPPFEFIHSYHLDENYIDALVNSIKERFKLDEYLLFSFHSIPLRYEIDGDYYRKHCEQTALAIVNKLGLNKNQWGISFQSRFGKEEWIQPYTDKFLEMINQTQAITKVAVVCPGFATDCLETLEEITIENKEIFLRNGGKSFQYIPALNEDNRHIEALGELIKKYQ